MLATKERLQFLFELQPGMMQESGNWRCVQNLRIFAGGLNGSVQHLLEV
jgi:hypothetical protein